ncbi:MAG: hypothetical protein E7580_04170 [Ruminococcaceae bacterium]|nr:hypothetical protein [Oscillospiraceae bacterium]
MFSIMFDTNKAPPVVPKEGDLYKEVTIGGKTFRLFYGYYEEFEREGQYNDPMPIYPDLQEEPIFTDDGEPIITAIQDVCEHYSGKPNAIGDGCIDCLFFEQCEELFGICKNKSRKQVSEIQTNVQDE